MALQHWEVFLCVAKNLSFTKAAQELYTTQPTISRQIHMLEEEWGFPLFLRNNKEVRLTFEGAIMAKRIRNAMNLVDAGLLEVADQKSGRRGEIRIGCLEAVDFDYFVTPTAVAFSRNFPEMNVSVEKGTFSELRRKLEEEKLDIVFTLDFELPYYRDIVYNEYYPTTAGLLLSRNHPLAACPEIDPEKFADLIYIMPAPEESPGRAEEMKTILGKLGITMRHIIYVENQETILLYVRSGRGAAVVDTSVRSVLDTQFYRFFPLPKEIAPLALIYLWKRNNLNPAVALYTNMLLEKEFIDVYNN